MGLIKESGTQGSSMRFSTNILNDKVRYCEFIYNSKDSMKRLSIEFLNDDNDLIDSFELFDEQIEYLTQFVILTDGNRKI